MTTELKWVAVVACALLSGALAWRKVEGWGWFLLGAFVFASTYTD